MWPFWSPVSGCTCGKADSRETSGGGGGSKLRHFYEDVDIQEHAGGVFPLAKEITKRIGMFLICF